MLRALFVAASLVVALMIPTRSSAQEVSIRDAEQLVSEGKFLDAYKRIQPAVEDSKHEFHNAAIGLMHRTLGIPLHKIKSFTPEALASLACEIGFEAAKLHVYKTLELLAPFNFDTTPQKVRRDADAYFLNPDSADSAAKCEQETREERRRVAAEAAAAESATEARKKAEEEASIKYLTEKLPSVLKEMTTEIFCVEYGRVVRGDPGLFDVVTDQKKYFDAEVKRRGALIDRSIVLKEQVRIGMSYCSLLASWGHPKKTNRSVGPWGVHRQMIYGSTGPYVYVENGVVKSFQD